MVAVAVKQSLNQQLGRETDKAKKGFKQTACEWLQLIELILLRNAARLAWLNSEKLYDQLEMLYTVHLPTTAEWNSHLEVIYHDFLLSRDLHLPASSIKPKDKITYEVNFLEVET